jgi:4-phospho-D-threonate 3-dehydrogenase / 4-phospho-D-erythronate 3-dehydrogenase
MNRIALTIGDPNGIGPEVCAKALRGLDGEKLKRVTLIGEWFPLEYYFSGLPEVERVYVKPSGFDYLFQPGVKSPEAGKLSYLFIEKAVELALAGKVRGIVTGPLSKELVRAGQKDFTDHTTWLARKFNVKDFNMLFYSKKFQVVLATIHVPLKMIPRVLKKETVRVALKNAVTFCEGSYGKENYRIAVCGLNPHAGENGMLGNEEKKIIGPVSEEFRAQGYPVDGPLPADTVFYKAEQGKYQMVVAMYHDQGLAPFKMLYMNEGVNVTLGLPIVRTSPDHGTAFDIAGKNIADPRSMEQALLLALEMTNSI